MSRRKFVFSVSIVAASLAVAGAITAGCGGGGAALALITTRAYLGTQAPGDVWTWSFDNAASTFSAANQTLSHNYTGTSVDLPSGFRKLTIGTSDDSNVSVGMAAYAIEIPGTALVIKPAKVGSAPIIACGLGSNAADGAQLHYNWVTVPKTNWNAADINYGTVDFVVSGTSYNGTIKSYLADGTLSHTHSDGFVNNGGVLTTSGGGTGALTPSGTFMLDFGPGNGGAIGVQQSTTPISITDFCQSGREYRGILMRPVDPNNPTDPHNGAQCIYGTGAGSNLLDGGNFTDIEAGTKDVAGSGVTISIDSQPSPGLLHGTLTELHDNSAHPIFFAINKVKGKYAIFGLGTDSGGYNITLIEQ